MIRRFSLVCFASLLALPVACGGSDDTEEPTNDGAGGSAAGSAGASGASGTGGAAGTAGTAGKGGAAGTGGGGASGAAGTAGTAGTAGAGGASMCSPSDPNACPAGYTCSGGAGAAGAAGAAAGAAGTAGTGGTAGVGGTAGAGTAGTGGTAGAGTAGTGGTAGAGGATTVPNGCVPTCNPANPLSCGPEKICKSTGNGGGECVVGCVLDEPTSCAAGHVCEPVVGGEPKCFGAVQIQGIVERAIEKAPIGGAHVAARDEGGGVVGNIAVTAADGTYSFTLSAKRKPDGTPVTTLYTLRADAAGFQTFPGGLRPALPVDLGKAVAPATPDGVWVLKNATTTIDLFPIANTAGLGTIRGTVKSPKPGGTLLDAGGVTGIADSSGAYAIFNVPSGMATVTGYAANLQLSPASATVPAGGEVKDVDLSPVNKPTATVSGNVNIVNAPGGSKTSVVLVVEDTFIPSLEIGEVPKGLRASDVSGAFSIAGVPDGKWVVLASLDNDGLVRDPDTSIAGTQIVKMTVTNGVASTTAFNFKVTEALAVKSPGANGLEEVTAPPTFVWADDASEDAYTLRVFDAAGTLVWEKTGLPPGKGGADISLPYAGPALKSGTIYQFRAISTKMGTPISRTEELRGVFLFK